MEKIPFYFAVDLRNESTNKKEDFFNWLDKVITDGSNLELEGFSFARDWSFGGFSRLLETSTSAQRQIFNKRGAFGCHEDSKKLREEWIEQAVSYDYWLEHIKYKTYFGVGSRSNPGGSREVVSKRLLRHQVIAQEFNDPILTRALNSAGLGELAVHNFVVLDAEEAQLYPAMSYAMFKGEEEQDIPTPNGICATKFSGREYVAGEQLPIGLVRSLKSRGIVKYCNYYRGLEVACNFVTVVIDGDGNIDNVSNHIDGLCYAQRDGMTFLDDRIAGFNGYVHCNVQGDYLPRDEANIRQNAVYHRTKNDNGYTFRCEENETPFRVGFEIEKECEDTVQIPHTTLYNESGWIKESDGSLDDEWGYELVSPVFNLMNSDLEKDIRKYPDIEQMINGDYTELCGGHINISSMVYSPIQLFYGLKGFLPLLYSVWRTRVDMDYSQARKINHYANNAGESDHHSAVSIKNKCLEIRIASAVRNVSNLLWRRDLVRIMIKHINKSEKEVLRMMLNPESALHKHLRKVYSGWTRYTEKCNEFVKFSNDYNDINLGGIDWSRYGDEDDK